MPRSVNTDRRTGSRFAIFFCAGQNKFRGTFLSLAKNALRITKLADSTGKSVFSAAPGTFPEPLETLPWDCKRFQRAWNALEPAGGVRLPDGDVSSAAENASALGSHRWASARSDSTAAGNAFSGKGKADRPNCGFGRYRGEDTCKWSTLPGPSGRARAACPC